jgi:carboxymethylenebutenolidase
MRTIRLLNQSFAGMARNKMRAALVMAGVIVGIAALTGDKDALHPRQPLELAGALQVPVLGLYGAADQGIPVAMVEKFRADLAAAKSPSEIVVYPEAPHGFHADYRPSYRAGPAAEGWKRLLDWFKQHGVV